MIRHIKAKSILNISKKRDSWFLDEYTVNPYSGCSFNCIYCYIRGSKYGEHMEESLSLKSNAAELLDKQLRNLVKKKKYGFIVLSSATDPYLQAEETIKMTRQLLEVILNHRFPVHIITKSNLVLRDMDLLQKINKAGILPDDLQSKLQGATLVTFSFSTTNDAIGKIFEPGATPPSLRLEALKKIKTEGLHSGVSLMPLIPYITDTSEQLTKMFETFKSIPVDYILPASLTLFGHEKYDSRMLMLQAVNKHYPELSEKYHRLFDHSDYMPAYYTKAFTNKMTELCKFYGLKNSIL